MKFYLGENPVYMYVTVSSVNARHFLLFQSSCESFKVSTHMTSCPIVPYIAVSLTREPNVERKHYRYFFFACVIFFIIATHLVACTPTLVCIMSIIPWVLFVSSPEKYNFLITRSITFCLYKFRNFYFYFFVVIKRNECPKKCKMSV